MGRRKASPKLAFKVGDKVLYTIPGGRPQDVEHEWEITHTFSVVDGTMACLSRWYEKELEDGKTKKTLDRCNAEVANLKKLD